MASTAKQVIEYLKKLDPNQMVIWQIYTQDDFEIGDNFYVSKETWNEFAEANQYEQPDWSMCFDEIETNLSNFLADKQDACEHAELRHIKSHPHLADCLACEMQFDCQCRE
jgi:hypothetical protein